MKQKLTLLLSFCAMMSASFAQDDVSAVGRRLLGVHLNSMDVKSPKSWKDNSSSKTLGGLKEQDLGFSISFWKLIAPKVDVSAKATMMFHNYAADDRGVYSARFNQIGIEVEPTVNIKALDEGSTYNAFVTAGLGFGSYSNKFGMYAPAGLGLQANVGKGTNLLLQSQYRFTLMNDVLSDNLFYSLGLVGTMSPKKEKAAKVELPKTPVAVDTDGDGVYDKDDKCPSVAGSAKYKGCPVPDTDGDGINDDVDKCPKEKGVAKYNGCPVPDSDKDGVNDESDKCPNAAGPASNQGCPVIDKKIIEKVSFEAKNIFFETNSAKLAEGSMKSLDGVFQILKSDRTLMLSIEGHSDNTGNPEANKTLSQSRADAVKDYFVAKGILASRLNAVGYGSEKPIADNNTEEGRAKNRRTELVLSNH